MKKIKEVPTPADQVYQARRRNRMDPKYHAFLAHMRRVAENLDKYMRFRAVREGVGYKFDPAFYQIAMWLGADTFFGVTVKGDELISDEQQPVLFEQWKAIQ
jgi:hypothetical protein